MDTIESLQKEIEELKVVYPKELKVVCAKLYENVIRYQRLVDVLLTLIPK